MTIRTVACAIALGIAVVACGSAATATPPASQATAPSPTPSPSVAPSPTPSATATPTAAASTSASAATCPMDRQTGLLPSDRMTNVEILGLPGRDVVRFSFGDRSLEPKGPATGTLDVATPPFTGGASGLPIDLKG